MHATVIDTLRYADRLKEAGLEPGQAEAMSRALNDELTEGLVTRTDLDDAVLQLKGDIGELGTRIDGLEGTVVAMDKRFDAMDADLEAKFGTVDSRFEAIDVRFDAIDVRFETIERRLDGIDSRFEVTDARFEAVDRRFDAVDYRFDAVDTQFHALRSQSRYLFLVLALIAGLGLYNATAPHFVKGATTHQDRTDLR